MDAKRRLQELMDERGWTMYKVAKEANIPWSTVRNMFKRNTEPSISTLECLCKGMGITLSQFFQEKGTRAETSDLQKLLCNWSNLSKEHQLLVLTLTEALAHKN